MSPVRPTASCSWPWSRPASWPWPSSVTMRWAREPLPAPAAAKRSASSKRGLLAEHADGQNGLKGRQVPVPVGVEHVAGDGRIPDVQEGPLAAGDVRLGPAVVAGVAEQFGRVDELEGLEPGTERAVGSRDLREGGRPGVQEIAGLVGVGAVARDRPHQGVLVGGGRVGDGLVLEVGGAAAPGGDLAGVLDRVRRLGARVGGERQVAVVDRGPLGGDRGFHTAEVVGAVQQARVCEGTAAGLLVGGPGGGGREQSARPRHQQQGGRAAEEAPAARSEGSRGTVLMTRRPPRPRRW